MGMLRQQLDTQKHTHETNVAELERENERLLTLNKILETEKKLQSVELSSTNQELTRVQQELAHAQTELRELRVLGEKNGDTTAGDGVVISAYGKKDIIFFHIIFFAALWSNTTIIRNLAFFALPSR